ncbi:epidermal growth factor receptor-like isoform X2 [Mya arenaria]|uniref:epidermal growth factor receptor-like isoform X2 n=1 Tax=Mya arenaria TaxID=6604 RepID=UPI0022E5CEA9|nr:epidermal growth factor receptor-like isoform X2 [Mya arenaria]
MRRCCVLIGCLILGSVFLLVSTEDLGAYESQCNVNSDCQLGFVCMSQKCSCDSSYVYDLRTESCKKICRGSNESFVKHDSFDHQYQIYKNRYTNCSYVDGNLELTNLEGSYDLGFLKDIEEVDGYVLILNVFSNYLNLTNLRIIRGKELFHHREEDYSLYVALNHNPYNDTQGLLELQFNSLSEVVRGKVHFLNNNLLCFANTIRWDDINPSTRPAFSIVFNSKNYKRQCPPCPKECYDVKTGDYHCWGSGPGMCQKLNYIKEVCSASCDGRCFGDQQNQCCHPECAAGCAGPRKDQCDACKNFYNEGQCHPFCPMMRKYDQSLMKWVENPDGRYSFGSLCVKECPLYLVKDNDACVIKCPENKKPNPKTNKCEQCDGACPKKCPGLDDSSFLNSKNIEDFRGCTIVDGSLSILGVSFLRDVHLGTVPLKLEDLNVLKDVRTINGYLSIQELPNEAESISFLSGLEIINGRFLTSTYGLSIIQTSIDSLGLTSLKQITNGDVGLARNAKLCFIHDLDLSIVFRAPTQKFKKIDNQLRDTCDAEGKTCHSECSKHGCWGPGPDKCLKCKNKRVETTNQCVAKCTDVPMLYEAENNTCRACHEQCAEGCSGPGDDQCFQCLKVKVLGLNNTAVCMTECPVPLEPPFLYPDEQKICRQCDMACADGCTGNKTIVGFGGCMTCDLAINRTIEQDSNGTTESEVLCLNKSQVYCPDGYFEKQYRSKVPNHPLNKKQVCQPCDPMCLTCSTEGVANCPDCRYYRYENLRKYSTCVESCPKFHYPEQKDCSPCHNECLNSCTGPTSMDCDNCRKFKIITSVENGTFKCVEECPASLPFLVDDTDPDKPTMTVCAADDHPTVLLRKAKSKEEERKKILSIAIPTVGGVLLLGLLLTLFGYYWRQRERAKENTMKLTTKMMGVDDTVPLTPTDAKPDLSKLRLIKESELRRGGIIGSGAFGTVYKGFYIPEGENVKIPVAIKVLQDGTSPNQNQELLEEARVMASVEHPCCIRILAVCMASQMMLITQLMPLGCLLEYIKKHKENTGSKSLLNWCTQIARGMSYLEERGIVHRDLAARNVLVQSAGQVKITDFGLAKLLDYNEEVYQSAGGKMPIKWLALECIQSRVFTHKSDVWSFGVTVWELFTYGGRPYESVRARDVPDLLEKGERLPQPNICTIDVYMIMIKCWMLDAESRPSFIELAEEFSKMARDPGRYLVIQGDELKKIPSEEVLDKPDDSRIVEGDKLMRLPSYSYDKDDLARHLSVGDAGTEEVVEAEEYLQPAPPPPLELENNNFKMMGAGASNRPIREKRYGHLESAAVAKQQRDLSPNNRLRVDSFNSRYCSDPVKYTRSRDEPDGRVGILKHPPSPPPPPAPLGNGNIPGYSPGYGPYIHGPESIPSQRLNLPLDEDDYLQPKSVNPKAYLDLENNKEYYLNEKQMSQASRQQPYTDPSDNYLVPNSVPTIFENPDYFEGDPRDSVFDRKTPPRHNSDSSWKSVNKPKVAPKPRRLTDYYNDLGSSDSSQPESQRLLSSTSNCSSAV